MTAEKSSSYSTIFSVVLPAPSLPLSERNPESSYIPTSPSSPTHTPTTYLPNLRPIFPPPPFTPSHPVFVHLSSLAASKSQGLRTDAEAYFAELVKEKVTEIEKTEAELRRHVEILWRAFREGVDVVKQERDARAMTTRRKDSGTWQDGVDAVRSKPSPALVTVHDFNPVASPRRAASPPTVPRMSSLSASLATSSFHHPKAQADQARRSLPSNEASMANESPRFSPPYLSDPSSSLSSKSYSSLSSRSSRSMSIRASVNGPTYLEPFRRNMDQANDAATSFRYFTIFEADKTRTQRKAVEAQGNAGQSMTMKSDNAVTEEAGNGMNGSNVEKTNRSSSRKTRSKSGDRKKEMEVSEVSPKGKRKVTFDVKPDVITIKTGVDADKKEDTKGAGGDSEGQPRLLSNSRYFSLFLLRNDI